MEDATENSSVVSKKFRQAGWMFTLMNLAYLILTYLVLPPMGLDPVQMVGYTVLVLILSGAVSWFLCRGARKLALMLAVFYAGRSGYAVYTLVAGSAFPIVPWVLPTIVIAFYFLGRPVWNWP